MKFESDVFTLREWHDADVGQLVIIANSKKISDNLRDGFPHPYRNEDAIKWIEFTKQNNDPVRFFTIDIDGKVTGSIGIMLKDDIYRKNAETGYYIGEEYSGKGIMTNVVKKIAKYIFENFNIIRIYAEPFAENVASRRVLEKAGFKCEIVLKNYIIKNNKVQDGCIYSILKEEYEGL